MKLLTYNFLSSKALKGVKVGYPMKLTISKREMVECEFNSSFLERLLPKLDWSTVRLAADIVEMKDLPEEMPANINQDEELLKKLHHLLMEIDVLEGQLECPETGRPFPITDGIPNMLINEDEV